MGTRIELQEVLSKFSPNVYFQPASNIQLKYPCIVYSRSGKDNSHANDSLYLSNQEYTMTVIDAKSEGASNVADSLQSTLQYCSIVQYYTADNLNHVTLNLTF